MHNFEQIRAHLQGKYKLTASEPYLACVQLSLSQGRRHQSIFLSEMVGDDGRPYLRVSTVIAPMTGIDARRMLAFNWESRVGYLALGELDSRALPAAVREPPVRHPATPPSSTGWCWKSAAWATRWSACCPPAATCSKAVGPAVRGSAPIEQPANASAPALSASSANRGRPLSPSPARSRP